jgi:arginyl-tRNA--protein-N-Asp/Glu arginylyltransferase
MHDTWLRDLTLDMRAPADNRTELQRLAFYATPEHECSYLPNRTAVTLFADPAVHLDTLTYSRLARFGFRRSGRHIYRPACPACDACISVRVPVDAFHPRRSQRRTWQRNGDLSVRRLPAAFRDEHFDLYRNYVRSRHPGGGMDAPDPGQYMEFLTCDWSDTEFVEFRLQGRLLAVAVVDHLDTGLSAVYTFFDPEYRVRSLGTQAILWEINEARRLNLPWVYLGYWIPECRKMAYKTEFSPLEQFREGRWIPVQK